MDPTRDDQRIAELFQALKTDDARRTPSLASCVQSSSARRDAMGWSGTLCRVAAAVAILALVGGLVVMTIARSQSESAKLNAATAALAAWRAPTDSLLELPGQAWFRTVPAMDRTIEDMMMTASPLSGTPSID